MVNGFKWFKKIYNFFSLYPKNKKDLIDLLRNLAKNNILESKSLIMIEGVLAVSELRVTDAMLAKSEIIMLHKNMLLNEIVEIVNKSGHSRFPVLGENKNEIIGILLAKDLLQFSFNNLEQSFNINEIIRPCVFIPESKRLDILLQDFKTNRSHLAIVIDEYANITGLISIEDVLEQIVGNIEDEFDTEDTPLIQQQSKNTYLIKAIATLDEFNSYFKSNITAENIDTIGGFVIQHFGYLPNRNEQITIDNYTYKILNSDPRRIHIIQLQINHD